MPTLEDQINTRLASMSGFNQDQVQFLRGEFRKLGRNPMEASIDLIAIENGYDEGRVRALFDMHQQHMRKMDGFAEQRRAVYD